MSVHATICGFDLVRHSTSACLDDILQCAQDGRGAWLVTLNTEMLALCARDASYRELIQQADIITADGMPLVWASRYKNKAIAGRTTGVDLVDAYLRVPEMPAYAIIGGQDPMATLERYAPAARQACRYLYNGIVDLSDAQLNQFSAALKAQDVRIVFIALGVPKQDRLALQLRAMLPHLVVVGIGGTFEILGPKGGRAPRWMQRVGMEWLYRLGKEPRRLWKRYLISYPAGVRMLVRDCLKA
ncbi:WecB/TagA/CpsF family glycosyltransferase [Hydrogenophaga sp.]|uniref:WecB/TagA/CpsF family glycosyltransferase n=1 Tax=Hydrogenophaga sp. TaxID=1904254 RepID=UPI003D102F3D